MGVQSIQNSEKIKYNKSTNWLCPNQISCFMPISWGAEKSASFFFARCYKEQGFYETFVEILGMDIKEDVK
ncbi:hypothetical protein COL68_08625 [Bacillus wiedmannii]|uniref:Uncharacterized protein n=1 Tax=Bacillus wiedmannii TaxID=1890302 RepID=A0A2C4LQQ7_9BACI|nr:hypothetical protein CN646_25380 [Bacillus wiedmannii]PEJ46472.1 hypothetical protein CN672_18500 [Bacillus wiedmannii]PEJ69985.1 hypothetical protein CN888_23585 [Bacillus wiedmannii]PEK65237.1 hypothetical protein CN595_01650 [Bacillus wiedmannii]PEL18895.1 hypothetical protein CN599_11075 [Bacillus wiedmannii]